MVDSFNKYIISNILSKEDIVSFSTCKKIFHKINFDKICVYFDANTSIKIFQFAINLSTVIYQYVIATWFMYFFTTVSGLQKIMYLLSKNPIFIIPFITGFYIRILGEPDAQKMEALTAFFGCKNFSRTYFVEGKYCSSFIENFESYLKIEIPTDFKKIIEGGLRTIVASRTDKSFTEILENILYKNKDIYLKEISTACYFNDMHDIFIDTKEIDEFLQELKASKKGISPMRRSGKNVCIGDCKKRVKTGSGCYCDGECYATVYGMKPWCYINEKACSKKPEKNITGKTWSYCEPEKVSKNKKCFTGKKYETCEEL